MYAAAVFHESRCKGGRHGSIRSEDGLLDLSLAMPKVLGGNGGATNPEQLFAGGYAACSNSAIRQAALKGRRRRFDRGADFELQNMCCVHVLALRLEATPLSKARASPLEPEIPWRGQFPSMFAN
jgi:hypothetical protein